MVSAGVCFGGKGRLHFIPDKTKVNAKIYVETLLPELVQDCRSVCHLALSFNRTARLHTRQSWLKTGLLQTAVNSLVKMNGLRTRLTSTLWTTMPGELCLNATSHFNPAGEHRWTQESSGVGTSCHRTQSTKPYWASRNDLGLCESWWWTLRTYAKMNYLSDFGIYNNLFLDNENYKLLLIIPCRIKNMA